MIKDPPPIRHVHEENVSPRKCVAQIMTTVVIFLQTTEPPFLFEGVPYFTQDTCQ